MKFNKNILFIGFIVVKIELSGHGIVASLLRLLAS